MDVSCRRDRFRSPEFFFLCSSMGVGLLLICLTPPMQTPDEGAHFERAWQIADGGIVPERRKEGTGGVLPVSVNSFCRWFEQFNRDPSSRIPNTLTTYREWHDQPVDPDKRMFIVFSNTAAYPPLPYLPQAAGIIVARAGGASVAGCLLLCRLFNLLTAVAVTVWAIRISPVQRWTIVLLAMTPMSMYLNASASSDALTNAIAMLFVASILRFAYGGDCGCPRRRGTWLLLLAVLLGLIKQGYFPLALLAVLIPWQSGEARRLKWVFAIAIIAVTAISVATWGIVVQSTYSPMRDNIDPAAQLTHVREHLTDFFGTLLNTLFGPKYLSRHVEQFLGYLGTLDTPLPTWLLTIHGLAIGLTALRGNDGTTRIHGRQRLYVAAVVLTNYALLAFTIYMTWMRVGDTEIRVQGRYLIPLGFPFCIALSGLWPLGPSSTVRWRSWLAAWLIIEYSVVAAILVDRYFSLTQ